MCCVALRIEQVGGRYVFCGARICQSIASSTTRANELISSPPSTIGAQLPHEVDANTAHE